MAHSLSQMCRFLGHTDGFYSVAQHSVLVSQLVPREDALWGLLHDASEAYLCDLPAPIKRDPEMGIYRRRGGPAHGWRSARGTTCRPEMPLSVKLADRMLLATEFRDVTTMDDLDWISAECGVEPLRRLSHRVRGRPSFAEKTFLDRFEELTEMTPLDFLELLWQYKPEEQYILIWTLPGQAVALVHGRGQGCGVRRASARRTWTCTSASACRRRTTVPRGGASRRRSSGICGIGTDLDLKSEAHGNKPLPTTLADALSDPAARTCRPPSSSRPATARTPGGCSRSRYVFETDEERARTLRAS